MSTEIEIEKMEKRIRQWRKEFPENEFVVRGQSRIYGTRTGNKKVSSTLYRQAKKELGGWKAVREVTPEELLEKERDLAASTRRRSLPLITDAEVLSDLQHFGGPTNCIDFTRDIYIALFFACSEYENSCCPGELIFLRHTEVPLTLPQNFKIPVEGSAPPEMEIVVPSTTDIDKNRSLFQHSLFVRHHEGRFNVPPEHVLRIKREEKALVRSILSNRGVSHASLFNDTFGLLGLGPKPAQNNWLELAKNPEPDWSNNSGLGMKNKGIFYYCKAAYLKAIQCFRKAVREGLSGDEIRRLRASAYLCNGDYFMALRHINYISEAAWNDRDYFLTAIAYYKRRRIGHSLRAINNAIRFNPYRTIYHHFRIMIRRLFPGEPSISTAGPEYLDHFIKDPDVRRIVSEKIIDTEKSDEDFGEDKVRRFS